MAKKTAAEKAVDKQQLIDGVKFAVATFVEAVKTPIVAGLSMYMGVSVAGQLKNSKGEYIMSDIVYRSLRGLSFSYPVYAVSQGGTAGIGAGFALGAVIAAASNRDPIQIKNLREVAPLSFLENNSEYQKILDAYERGQVVES